MQTQLPLAERDLADWPKDDEHPLDTFAPQHPILNPENEWIDES